MVMIYKILYNGMSLSLQSTQVRLEIIMHCLLIVC
uniref:Uncharacterized protein n=1 Tax=Rhizophora mucronata TaxID=61149 RepID=A0A2P2Q759_RHIMU